MICRFCKEITPGFFQREHDECREIMLAQWKQVEDLMKSYEEGKITSKDAAKQVVRASSGEYLQIHMWSRVQFQDHINSSEHLVYSAEFIDATEEKNRVHMDRPGLSYARYPKWETAGKKICEMGILALTDKGVYIMDIKPTYIPYKKIVDVGTKKFLSNKEVYIDVKTSSPHGHRYCFWSKDPVEDDIADITCRFIKMMTGIKTAYRP